MKSQNALILKHLQSGKSITSLLAFTLYGILRLSARIWDLRQAGYAIESRLIAVGNGKHVSSYKLKK